MTWTHGLPLVLALFCLGCSSTPPPDAVPPQVAPVDMPSNRLVHTDLDPWEGFNRRMYAFNAGLDRHVLLPITRTYRRWVPSEVRHGVDNALENLGEVSNFANNLLQGKPKRSLITLARFGLNTTIGIFGLWDPAEHLGLHRYEEDFGQTLAVWGVPDGPYLVLPVFGPSSLRDTGGLSADMTLQSEFLQKLELDEDLRTSITVMDGINQRAQIDFTYYQTGSAFEYELIRTFYLIYRDLEIER